MNIYCLIVTKYKNLSEFTVPFNKVNLFKENVSDYSAKKSTFFLFQMVQNPSPPPPPNYKFSIKFAATNIEYLTLFFKLSQL